MTRTGIDAVEVIPIEGEDHYVVATRRWLESIVVGLNLCPFAGRELARDTVRFSVSAATTELELLQSLEAELLLLSENPAIETSLLIHPQVLAEFTAYNQFLNLADSLLATMNLLGVFQIASFHPHYRFADTSPDDRENYTNRSPYPCLHLLREASLTAAIDAYGDADAIPERNIATMRSLSGAQMRTLFGA